MLKFPKHSYLLICCWVTDLHSLFPQIQMGDNTKVKYIAQSGSVSEAAKNLTQNPANDWHTWPIWFFFQNYWMDLERIAQMEWWHIKAAFSKFFSSCLSVVGHRASPLMSTGCVEPLKGDWVILCNAGRVGRVISQGTNPWNMPLQSRIEPGLRRGQWYTFILSLNYHDRLDFSRLE